MLLRNDGTLPLAAPATHRGDRPERRRPVRDARLLLVPDARRRAAPGRRAGHRASRPCSTRCAPSSPTARSAARAGTSVDGGETDGIADAAALAASADVVVLALGDRAGLFGRGTSGEGCDAESLDLPGAQQQLVDAVLDDRHADRLDPARRAGRTRSAGAVTDAAAIVQAFFAGEEGARAIAGVLSGRVNPSGRLPVSVPGDAGHAADDVPRAAARAGATTCRTSTRRRRFPFGHGLGYAAFDVDVVRPATRPRSATDGAVDRAPARARTPATEPAPRSCSCTCTTPSPPSCDRCSGSSGYARVELAPGDEADGARSTVPADLASFTGRDGRRIVEPGSSC